MATGMATSSFTSVLGELFVEGECTTNPRCRVGKHPWKEQGVLRGQTVDPELSCASPDSCEEVPGQGLLMVIPDCEFIFNFNPKRKVKLWAHHMVRLESSFLVSKPWTSPPMMECCL